MCLATLRSIFYFICCLFNAKSLHNNVFNSVLHAKSHFFDINPVGRLMNRFSKDIANIDDNSVISLYQFFLVSQNKHLILFITQHGSSLH